MTRMIPLNVLLALLISQSTFRNSGGIPLPPSFPDALLIGCYKEGVNDTNLVTPAPSNLSTSVCLRTCANLTFPLALLLNGSNCKCSREVLMPKVNLTFCNLGTVTTGGETNPRTHHVYNASDFLTVYIEVLKTWTFKAPVPSNLETSPQSENSSSLNQLLYSFTFGDGGGNSSWGLTPSVQHRYRDTGKFKVCALIKFTNESRVNVSCRDVIVQARISHVSMSCPQHAVAKEQVDCQAVIIKGSDAKVDLGVTSLLGMRGTNKTLSLRIQDTKRIVIGNTKPNHQIPTSSEVLRTKQETTHVMPSLKFNGTTNLEAWEVVATTQCNAKLQIFRPIEKVTLCGKNCTWSKSCFEWRKQETPSMQSTLCKSSCIHIQHCSPNTTESCKHFNNSYTNVFTSYVFLKKGYNFVPVLKSNGPFLAECGDVIGWASNISECIQAYGFANDSDGVYLFPGVEDTKNITLQENTTRLNTSYAIQMIGSLPFRVRFTFCHPFVDQIIVRSRLGNDITAANVNSFQNTIAIQLRSTRIKHKFPKYMALNESKLLTITVTNGTNLTCSWNFANKAITFSPFRNGSKTDGITDTQNVTFYRRGTHRIHVTVYNLVSRETLTSEVTVRIRVTGIKAFLCHAPFAYRAAVTCFNTSYEQGESIDYYWRFANPNTFISTKTTTASHIFRALRNSTVVLFADNIATFDNTTISIRVIHNPLSLRVPSIIEAGKPLAIKCNIVLPGGSPSATPSITVDFGDGQSTILNSTKSTPDTYIAYHSYVRNLPKRYKVQCIVTSHPELNIVGFTQAINAVKGLQIGTNCSRSIAVNERCALQALYTSGDLLSCTWLIIESRVNRTSAGCALAYTVAVEGQIVVILNAENPVSSLNTNLTFNIHQHTNTNSSDVSKDATVSLVKGTAGAPTSKRCPTVSHSKSIPATVKSTERLSVILAPSTVTIFSKSSSTASGTSLINPATSSGPFKQSTTLVPSNKISHTTSFSTVVASSTISPTTSSVPGIQNATLHCPVLGHVGQALRFYVTSVPKTPTLTYVWNFESSNRTSGSLASINHVFGSPGVQYVGSNVTHSTGHVFLQCKVTVQYLIMGFRITTLEVVKDKTIHIQFEITQGTNVSYIIDFGDDSGTSSGFLQTMPTVVAQTYHYAKSKEYTINIHVTSLVGPNTTRDQTVLIADSPCAIHDVTVRGASRDPKNAPLILPQNEYFVGSEVNASCGGVADGLRYTWTIFSINDTAITRVQAPEVDSFHSRELTLPSYTLSVGLYKFVLYVTATPFGVSGSGVGYLAVRMPRLVARIECGHFRTVSSGSDVTLNASLSYDPSDPTTGSLRLKFKWLCDSVRCNNTAGNRSVLHFPRKSLQGGGHKFEVVVTRGTRKAKAAQTIQVVDADLPSVCIRCIENCDTKAHLSESTILYSKVCGETNITCLWKLSEQHTKHLNKRSISPRQRLTTLREHHVVKRAATKGQPPQSSKQFVINKNDLRPNSTYLVTLEFKFNSTVGSAQYMFKTDSLPTGGACEVTPSIGKVIETPFQVLCSGWDDEDRPLWYEFFFDHPKAGAALLSYGWLPQSPSLYLPSGSPQRNYTLDLHVQIRDALGSRRTVRLQTQVHGFTASDGPVSAILKGYVQGPSSMLGRIIAGGKTQQAIQLMTTVSTLLNDDSEHKSGTSTGPGHADREQVRDTLTKELSTACCSSFVGLRQVLGGLQGATHVTTELSPNAQIHGSIGYALMATTLAVKYKQRTIENEAQGIVKGLSDVFESSANTVSGVREKQKSLEVVDWLDDSNAAKNNETLRKSNEASQTCVNGAEQIARALVTRKKPGDEPSHLRSARLEIAVSRQSTEAFRGLELDSQQAKFNMPQGDMDGKLAGFGFVDSKVLTMSDSPFLSEGQPVPGSHVSSLELQDPNGNTIAVNNLSEPISIYLNAKKPEDDPAISGILSQVSPNVTVYKITVKEPDTSIYLEANFSGLEKERSCSILWRKHSHPTLSIYDFQWNTSNGTFKKLITWIMLNNTGEYFLGISHRNRNASGDVHRVTYNISMNAVSCMYWKEASQAWSTKGCQVGANTTRYQIHCLCNHLTWFGSKLFVPPNTLDFDKIATQILEPSQYAAVLAVLCTIWGVYVIVIVWARREDKRDSMKVGVSFSPSNKPGNSYIYEVITSIGMRRDAGTTANAAILLYGDKCDSQSYLLADINYDRTPLARGSVNSFIVTTSEGLGELSYIRIWHDNSGEDPALFLKQVTVRDHETGETWHFLCNRWFAVDEGDGMIDRVLPVTSMEEMTQFKQLFLDKTYRDLTDSHLWFSVVWRPPQSPFSRVQRVSCCLSLLLCTMMANALWYKTSTGKKVDLGALKFSWEQISIGITSSLVVFPVNLLLVQIFRHCRPRKRKDVHPGRELNTKQAPQLKSFKTTSQTSKLDESQSVDYDGRGSQGNPMESENEEKHVNSSLHAALIFITLHMLSDLVHQDRNQSDQRQSLISSIEDNHATHGKKDKVLKGIPWWCVYIGWIGVILTSLVSTAVALLYGIQFGKRTSEKWLLSMFISVTQDIFVSQPLKVVALALFFAYILRKPNSNQYASNSEEIEYKEWLEDCSEARARKDVEIPSVPMGTLSEDALQKAREKREKERQMAVILKDVGTFLLFMIILLLIVYGYRDERSYLQKRSIEGILMQTSYKTSPSSQLTTTFNKAVKVSDIWLWAEHVLLPALYNLNWYYYSKKPGTLVQGGSGLVVGFARMRQLRIKKDTCKVAEDVQDVIQRCTDGYSTGTEDENDYEPGWVLHNTTKLSQPTLWHYNTEADLNGFPFIGNVRTYSGAGYVLEMSPAYYKALRQIKRAVSDLWIDRYSRAVFIEFTLYNPYSNLFTASTVLLEILPTGGMYIKPEFATFRLYSYVGDFQIFVLACEVSFLLFVSYFTYREVRGLYRNRRKYFSDLWNLIEITIVVLAWISVGDYFICFGIRKWTLQQHHKNPKEFTNFQYISAWQHIFENVMGFLVFTAFLKFIKLLRFNRKMFLLAYTLRHSAKDLIHYWFNFFIVFLAFSHFYFLLLGGDYQSFSTLSRSMEKLVGVLLGKFDFEQFMNPFRTLGAITFFLYMIITNFFLLNVLIAIVIKGFQETKRSREILENEFEVIDFTVERVREFLGIRKLNNTVGPVLAEDVSISSHKDTEPCDVLKQLSSSLDKLQLYVKKQKDADTKEDILFKAINKHIEHHCKNKLPTARI